MAKDIFEDMRKQLIERIESKYFNNGNMIDWAAEDLNDRVIEGWDRVKAMATIPQLWSLYKLFFEANTDINMIGTTGTKNDEYVYCNFAGLFVGIEADGYTHS